MVASKRRHRWGPLLLALTLLLVLSCTACREKETTYEVDRDGLTYTVDTVARTITQGENVYHYSPSGTTLAITFPDGRVYRQHTHDDSGSGPVVVTSSSLDEEAERLGATLTVVLSREWPPREFWHLSLPGLLLILIGLWNAISPQSAWYASSGWRYKDAEPSDEALYVHRVAGGFAIFLGIVLQF